MWRKSTIRAITGFERLLLPLGLLLISGYATARIYTAIYARAELRAFWHAQLKSASSNSPNTSPQDQGNPDFALWTVKRVAAYKTSLGSLFPPPLAVLKIPSLNLEVPVLPGTEDTTLDRALGHIDGTALPGQDGNVGIAGHRDGFFRALKDIHRGDAIDLFTQNKTEHFLVDEIIIVLPEDVSALQPRPKTSLTLVTCYPFYFVGSAPQRYIVHASIANSFDHEILPQQSTSTEKKSVHKLD